MNHVQPKAKIITGIVLQFQLTITLESTVLQDGMLGAQQLYKVVVPRQPQIDIVPNVVIGGQIPKHNRCLTLLSALEVLRRAVV